MRELGNKYSVRYLFDMRKLYLFSKVHPLDALLTISHYRILFTIKNDDEINYYIDQIKILNLGKRELLNKIKSREYERLSEKTKEKIKLQEKNEVQDFIKNPILIKNEYGYEKITERILQKLILEDLERFMKELEGFCFIASEHKIKMGDRYNYIDLLLFNIKYNCYVVIELKVTELRKEYIGQITTYMHYIDKNVRSINQEKTIGIIIVRKDNKFIMEYCSDERVYQPTYDLTYFT